MESSTGLFNYPFKQIQAFLDKEIESRLKKFYKGYNNEAFGPSFKCIDYEKKEVHLRRDTIYPGDDYIQIISFEKEIRYELRDLLSTSLRTIEEGTNLYFQKGLSVKGYLDKLHRQFNVLISHPKLKEYPFVLAWIKLIEKELDYYKRLDGVESENLAYSGSPFRPKDRFRRAFFIGLYSILVDYEVIAQDLPAEEFLEVFRESNTKIKLQFTGNNNWVAALFETIKPCFHRLRNADIGNSGRFCTKQGTIITASHYDKYKQRCKVNSEIRRFKRDLKDLISTSK